MTIQFAPGSFASVHDDLIYTVAEPAHTSDPVTYPNYKFIADIYINTVFIGRLKKVPDPVNNIGVFDVSQIVRSYVMSSFNPDQSSVTVVQQKFAPVDVQIKFGEEYSFTEYFNIVTDSTRHYYNHYNKQLVGSSSALTAFQNKVVSNRPDQIYVLSNSANSYLSYFATNTTGVNVLVTTSDGNSHTFAFTPVANNIHVLNIAPGWLNNLNPGLITGNTKSYIIQIGSTIYTVNIICEAIYDVYTLHFLNQYGGFESKLFTKVSRNTIDIQKKSFQQLGYVIDSSGVVSYYNSNNVYNENNYVYASQFNQKLLLNSDILSDGEYAWLADLVISPLIYIENGIYFIPCGLTGTNYEPKKYVNDNLTNLTVTIDYGKTFNAQYR